MKPLLDIVLDINREYLALATTNDVLDSIKARAINNGWGYRYTTGDGVSKWDHEQMLIDIHVLLREAWLEGRP